MDLVTYCRRVDASIRARDGHALRDLLRLEKEDVTIASEEYLSEPMSRNGATGPKLPIRAEFDQVVRKRLLAGGAVAVERWDEAHVHLLESLKCFCDYLKKSDENWSIPALHGLSTDVRILAEQADAVLKEKNQKADALHRTEFQLKKGFTICISDRSLNSKKPGALEMANQLFKVYFRLKSLHLCKAIITPLENPQLSLPMTDFPISHQVTYKYFIGRYHLYEDKTAVAVEELQFAFYTIPKRYAQQRRKLLQFLIPARLQVGILPKPSLLREFNITQYDGFVTAITRGDLNLFDRTMSQYQTFFIRNGVYLALEKVRGLTYRSLFRRVYRVMGTNKLPLAAFLTALKLMDYEMDQEELECILSNLIFDGFIKGYISHKQGYLVVSAKEAFPPLRSLRKAGVNVRASR